MKSRYGFTLVELLVATLVATIIAALVGVSLHAGFSAWARLSTGSHATLETVRMFSRLERDVASALPLMGKSMAGSRETCEIPRMVVREGNALALPVLVRWSFDRHTRTASREEHLLSDPEGGTFLAETFGPASAPVWLDYAPEPVPPDSELAWQEFWTPSETQPLPFLLRVRTDATGRLLPLRLHAQREAAP